jgi:myo-inositol-1(or 4)-monophosphatase
MTPQRSNFELVAIAQQVAEECSRIIVQGYRLRPKAGTKGSPVDLVTEFDLKSEAHLRQRLGELTPEIPILAEEHGGQEIDELCWFCDPLDGTTNFVHGHPFFAVSIGAMQNNVPIVGAVVAPVLNVTWLGYQGGPATRNGEHCHVSQTAVVQEALLATGFPPDRTREPGNNFAAWANVKRHCRGARRCGSASMDLCLVADGTYDGYWERNLHAWDIVAGAAIVLAAGGQISGLDGTETRLLSGNIVATNGGVHRELLGLIEGK